jgi:3-hydroxyisobutyryl-CoA hydrolase
MTGGGCKAFCAGGDILSLYNASDKYKDDPKSLM